MMTISNMCTAFTLYSTYFELFFCSWFFVVAQNYLYAKERIKMIFRVERKNADIYHQFYFYSKEKKFICVPSLSVCNMHFFGFFVLLLIRATMNIARHQTAEYGHDR